MTPYEIVRERYSFPFELHNSQSVEVNKLCSDWRVGYYWMPGCGKTAGSTHQAMYAKIAHGVGQWVIVMPPILLDQWALWLRKVTDMQTGKPPSVTIYAGTPQQRQKLDFKSDFTLMSYGIMKQDFPRIHDAYAGKKVGLICDEAHAVKNHESDTHKAVALFSEERCTMLLTGTPINKPGDAYAYVKLLTPGVYRNHRQFERIHVAERDAYEKVTQWENLDLLKSNLYLTSSRLLLRDVRKDMVEPLYTTVSYSLDVQHMKLYRRIAEEKLVEFENGHEIDAISAGALRSALQQIIVNWGEFAEDPSKEPAALRVIEEVLDEIGGRKLVVAAHFRRTNAYLTAALKKYGAVAIYGDVSPKDKQAALSRFINSPDCRVIVLQPSSAGFGVDGLQHVCSDMVVVEAPTVPAPFEQVVARLDRTGQNEVVHVRVAVALGTVQVKMFRDLLANDALANTVQGGYKDLKDSIYGT